MKKNELQRHFPPDFVSAETLAYRLDCSRSTIDEYVRLGLLPSPTNVGNLVRWDFEDVRMHIKAGVKSPAAANDDPYFNGILNAKSS